MAKKALLIVDMLRDFLDEKGALFCGQPAVDIIPYVKDKAKEFRAGEEPVFYIMDSHDENDPEFKLFPKHCVEGTAGAEVIDGLKPEDKDILVPKTSYDGMHKSDLDNLLMLKGVEEVYLTGVCTSICIMETANTLVKEGYKVFVYRKGVADFDPEAHRFALKRMETVYGAKII